jgi:hypothetical protein
MLLNEDLKRQIQILSAIQQRLEAALLQKDERAAGTTANTISEASSLATHTQGAAHPVAGPAIVSSSVFVEKNEFDVKEVVAEFLNARNDRVVNGVFNDAQVVGWLCTNLTALRCMWQPPPFNHHQYQSEQEHSRLIVHLHLIPQYKHNMNVALAALPAMLRNQRGTCVFDIVWSDWSGDELESRSIKQRDGGLPVAFLNKVLIRRSNIGSACYEMKFQ